MSRMKEIAIQIEEIKEQMCDHYCKYPGNDPDIESKCETCPMNSLDDLTIKCER